MLAIELTLGIFPVIGVVLCAFGAGFVLRGSQLRQARKRIIELEKEMLSNHAEILELQKERVQLLQQLKESRIPVIPIKSSKEDAEKRQANNSTGKN